jgi:phospholipid:diacylglycerol acyltransferase
VYHEVASWFIMSTLRHRPKDRANHLHRKTSYQSEKDIPGTPDSDVLELVPSKELHKLKKDGAKDKKVKGTKRRFAWIFTLGGLFGLILAAFLANNNDWIDIASALTDLNLDQILDVLPAGFLNEAREFQVSQRHGKTASLTRAET